MSSLPPSLVHQGFWIDHSHNAVLGSTITLTSAVANVVIVIVGALVTFTGMHLWRLIAFSVFVKRATDEKRNGMYHQDQILLRNASSPSVYILDALKMAIFWRNKVKRAWLKLAIATGLALICSIGFLAAGILSSKIVSTTNLVVQVQPRVCGHWPNSTEIYLTDFSTEQSAQLVSMGKTLTQIQNYERTCYNDTERQNPACQVYATPSINFNTSYSDCPFGDMCKLADNSALVLDTGLLDSHNIFGINAESTDRIQIRRKTSCAVLDSGRFIKSINLTDEQQEELQGRPVYPGEQFWSLDLGAVSGLNGTNITTIISSFEANFTAHLDLFTSVYYPDFEGNFWTPFPQLTNNESDTTLVMLGGNTVEFEEPIDDPWFSAHQKHTHELESGRQQTTYSSDEVLGALVCLDQYQFCSTPGLCTSLNSFQHAISEANALTLTPKQNATLRYFMYTISPDWQSSDIDLVASLNPPPLLAQDSLGPDGIASALPVNQWELETKNLYALVLSLWQRTITDLATGPLPNDGGVQYDQYLLPPIDDAERQLCYSQKMKAPNGFSNVNVFGLAFTVGICGLIVLVDYLLPFILNSVSDRHHPLSLRMRHWLGNDLLQVQRRAFESTGRGGEWTDCKFGFPVAEAGEEFVGLACDDFILPSKDDGGESETPSSSSTLGDGVEESNVGLAS